MSIFWKVLKTYIGLPKSKSPGDWGGASVGVSPAPERRKERNNFAELPSGLHCTHTTSRNWRKNAIGELTWISPFTQVAQGQSLKIIVIFYCVWWFWWWKLGVKCPSSSVYSNRSQQANCRDLVSVPGVTPRGLNLCHLAGWQACLLLN